MSDEFIKTTIETITTDGTAGYIILCLASGITLIVLVAMIYQGYKYLCRSADRSEKRWEIKDKMLHNEVYLDGVYSAYKAGLVHKEADEQGIEMKFNVIEEENGLIAKLNEEVSENLTN